MEEKVVLSDQRYEEIRNLVIKATGTRLDDFDATYVFRNGYIREIKAKIVADHGVSYGEFRGYSAEFEKRCMALISDEEFEKTEAIVNSINPGRHGGPMRVVRFHHYGSEKLKAAGYNVHQIVGAYGRHWALMVKLQRAQMDKEGIPHG